VWKAELLWQSVKATAAHLFPYLLKPLFIGTLVVDCNYIGKTKFITYFRPKRSLIVNKYQKNIQLFDLQGKKNAFRRRDGFCFAPSADDIIFNLLKLSDF
jgi:tricorn protease-like protein